MTGAFLDEWPLARGGRLVFVAHDDGTIAVDHMGRHDDSCGRIASDLSREDAEGAAAAWLRDVGKVRLMVIDGGRA